MSINGSRLRNKIEFGEVIKYSRNKEDARYRIESLNKKITMSLAKIQTRKPVFVSHPLTETYVHNLENWFRLNRAQKQKKLERENASISLKILHATSSLDRINRSLQVKR